MTSGDESMGLGIGTIYEFPEIMANTKRFKLAESNEIIGAFKFEEVASVGPGRKGRKELKQRPLGSKKSLRGRERSLIPYK